MSEYQLDPKIAMFIERLGRLEPGERARLKRNAGCQLAEARNATTLFYQILPLGVPVFSEEMYFLTATLFTLAESEGMGNLGDALRRARKDNQNDKGLDRRIEVLLDANQEQLPFRLRQVIHFLQSNRVKVNWGQLLADLLQWDREDRRIQRKWARSYFGNHTEE